MLTPAQKRQLCADCYSNIYNKPAGELVDGPGSGISTGECWHLDEAYMVVGLLVYPASNTAVRLLRQWQLCCWHNQFGASTVMNATDVWQYLNRTEGVIK